MQSRQKQKRKKITIQFTTHAFTTSTDNFDVGVFAFCIFFFVDESHKYKRVAQKNPNTVGKKGDKTKPAIWLNEFDFYFIVRL